MSKSKSRYRVSNWPEYDAFLKQRESLTFWLSPAVIEKWLNQEKTGRLGASNTYSDVAIQFMATVQSLFGLAGRQTQGFLAYIFDLMEVDLPVPDHSTLSRRLRKLNVDIPIVPVQEAIHLVVDSTGVKVYGEEEWKTRQHRIGKSNIQRKLHLDMNGEASRRKVTGEIVKSATNNVSNSEVFSDLKDGVQDGTVQVSGNSADYKYKFDTAVYTAPVQKWLKPTNFFHSVGKGSKWWKLLLDVNVGEASPRKATGEIVTTNNVSDSEVFLELLDGVEGGIFPVSGDGADQLSVIS